jgi:3-hydroxyisobutyrate dehydrogenase-like beta-hydroxyacid dehydrogenase
LGQFRFAALRRKRQAITVHTKLAMIGFGEAGATFARSGNWACRACAYDIASDRADAMRETGVRAAANAAEAMAGAGLVLSLVSADQALQAAEQCAPHIAPGAIWCDMNSASPDTKRAAAAVIEAAGGRYADAAVMAPVNPAVLAVPLLIAGDCAEAAQAALAALGFSNMRVVGNSVGQASAIKLIRSVMVKGIEALTAEMMAAADAAGVAGEVLASLDASEKALPWEARAAYNLERMAAHGQRRAAEMEEAAKMLEALGVDPVMTRGTVIRQRLTAQANGEA